MNGDRPTIGITMGDPCGIGAEIIIKALADPEMLRRARERDVIAKDARIHRATVHRALVRMAVPLTRSGGKRDADMRRFAYAHRMRMVLDGKHFRAGADRTKRVAAATGGD